MIEKFKNPFRFLPLRQAICWGIAAMILTAVYCWQVGLRMTSITQVNYAGGALWKATVSQVVVWLLFSVVLYVVGLMLSRSKIRFWDVAAYNLFARLPFNLSLLVFAVPQVRSVMALLMEGSLATVMQYQGTLMLVSVVAAVFSVWYYVWTYNAFSVATNLKGFKGVSLFIVGWLVAYVLSGYTMMLF